MEEFGNGGVGIDESSIWEEEQGRPNLIGESGVWSVFWWRKHGSQITLLHLRDMQRI
jgi:hypothetical protein